MPEHGNKRPPDQASQGATAWFSGAGSQPGLLIAHANSDGTGDTSISIISTDRPFRKRI